MYPIIFCQFFKKFLCNIFFWSIENLDLLVLFLGKLRRINIRSKIYFISFRFKMNPSWNKMNKSTSIDKEKHPVRCLDFLCKYLDIFSIN